MADGHTGRRLYELTSREERLFGKTASRLDIAGTRIDSVVVQRFSHSAGVFKPTLRVVHTSRNMLESRPRLLRYYFRRCSNDIRSTEPMGSSSSPSVSARKNMSSESVVPSMQGKSSNETFWSRSRLAS